MATFKQIVDSSKGSAELMHDTIEHVSNFVEKVAMVQPHLAKMFLQEQYELMNGQHLNEWLAKEIVSKMWHTAADGKIVSGETVTPQQAIQMLVDKDSVLWKWDAYVAANAFAHDLADTGISQEQIIKAARKFWFHDEDMPKGNKVYWYFKDEIFG